MNQPFFMVFMEGGQNPTYQHFSLAEAEAEAKRLAKNFNRKTWVLASIKSYELNEFLVKDCRPTHLNDLPF